MSEPIPNLTTSNTNTGRNFEPIAAHFAHKIYGSQKGKIRLAVLKRDLDACLPRLFADGSSGLRVLDIGAGLGQMAHFLAQKGADCTLLDLSPTLLDQARALFAKQPTAIAPKFFCGDYQAFSSHCDDTNKTAANQQNHINAADTPSCAPFDLILCHAVLEWVADPCALIAFIHQQLRVGGAVSLLFYNPAAAVYRNLLLGNFNHAQNPKPSDHYSLTPNHPVPYETVQELLHQWHLSPIWRSGVRVFSDYASKKQGGLCHLNEIIKAELCYSQQTPFWRMGRYLHIVAQKNSAK